MACEIEFDERSWQTGDLVYLSTAVEDGGMRGVKWDAIQGVGNFGDNKV